MKLLIACDGSDSANAAIDDLIRAGLPQDVEARVLSVADVLSHLIAESSTPAGDDAMAKMSANARDLALKAVKDAEAIAKAGASRIAALFPSWKLDAHACGDSPHWGIIKEAVAQQADLVVVGAQGRSALGRLLLGSVSQQVLTHAPCSVRVGRRGPGRTAEPVRLMLGVDGSVGSAAAVSAVAARKWPAESEVTIVTALDLQIATAWPMVFGEMGGGPVSDPETLITKSLHRIARELKDAGLKVTPVVKQGNPRRVLLAEAEARQTDCIFVGATGLTRVERLLLGSVSSSLAAHAPCSVEIIRA
jgi:nucleotide-binding universal stress UspA family protein